jgi:RNA polymerase sigma-70 factor, ECF subfamily
MRQEPERQARFVDLVHAHQGAIRKVAALYARDAADREDLFQEVVLQLWRSFDSFRGDAAFSTFLYRVALNTALMRLRRAYRRPDVEAGRALDEVPAAAPAPGHDDDDVERLYAAIRRLAALDRAIVLLVLEERSYEEIAAVTGLTRGNVSVRIVRIKERLRRLMGVAENGKDAKPCSTR